MATRLYFHHAANTLLGTFPTDEQNAAVPSWTASGATTLRTMDKTRGAAQASLSGSSLANTSAQNAYFGFFCSRPFAANQNVGGGGQTLTLNIANSESNAAMNLSDLRCYVYVWRPSTGAKVGDVRLINAMGGDIEVTGDGSARVNQATTTTTSTVAALAGDVLICEIWHLHTQADAVSRTGAIYYDGATENTTNDTVVTDHAGFLNFSSDTLTFLEPAELTSTAAASVTWTGEAVAASGSDWSLAATASATWAGASTSATSLSATALASLTWNGAAASAAAAFSDVPRGVMIWGGSEITHGAWRSSASGAIAGGVAGASVSAQPASLIARGVVTWGGAEVVSGFTSAEFSLSATSTLEWVGATIDGQDWRSVARLGFPPSANRWDGASITGGDWQAGAVAEATFANASIVTASADFSIGATASASFTGFEVTPFVFNHVVLDGKTPKPYRPEGMDEEDIPFIMAAITTVMENNHVNY